MGRLSKEDWEGLSITEKQDIYKKCKESDAYFYNNFVRREGGREISDEEFSEISRQLKMVVLKKRSIHSYPLLPEECFMSRTKELKPNQKQKQ